MTTIPAEKLPLILDFLNNPAAPGQAPPYGDGLDRIVAAKIDDNGDIIAIGQDGSKTLAIKIGDTQTSIRLANYEEQAAQEAAPSTAKFGKQEISQETLIAGIKQAGDEQIISWLDTVKDVLFTADDLDTAREAVFELYPDLDSTKLDGEVANYLTLASLSGYFEAQDD